MTPPRALEKGMHGDDVRKLQQSLITCGYGQYFPRGATGHFGELTEDAVQAFQKAHGLKADGKVGPETQRVLAREKVKAIAAEASPNVKHVLQPPPPVLPQFDGYQRYKDFSPEVSEPAPELKKPLIVLDPGHGFYIYSAEDRATDKRRRKKIIHAVGDLVFDEGAKVQVHLDNTGEKTTLYEANLIMPIAQALRKELQERGFDVLMTRETPSDQLPNRYEARSSLGYGQKQLHLTVHADSNPSPLVGGIDAYHKPNASSRSVQFAKALADPDFRVRENNRTAMLIPERIGKVPAALVEVGNVHNAQDLKRIRTAEGQLDIAETLAARIAKHYDSMCEKDPKLPPRQPVYATPVSPAAETGTDTSLPNPLPAGGAAAPRQRTGTQR